jgi:hypothetical protein
MIEIIAAVIAIIYVIGYSHLLTMVTRDRYMEMEEAAIRR